MRCTAGLILFFCTVLAALAEQVLPETLPTLPVLIQSPCPTNAAVASYGTGVYLTHSNKLFLVTAAHVIFDMSSTNRFELKAPMVRLSNFSGGTKHVQVVTVDLKQSLSLNLLKRHQSHDVATLLVGIVKSPTVLNYSPFVRSFDSAVNLYAFDATGLCKTFGEVPEASELYILGYPVELLNNGMPPEVDYSFPLVRKGIISQRNQKTGKFVIDSGVYGGNSGGPVLTVEHPSLGVTTFRLSGIIVQFVPALTRTAPEVGITNACLVNTGYSVAEPMDYAFELMRQY